MKLCVFCKISPPESCADQFIAVPANARRSQESSKAEAVRLGRAEIGNGWRRGNFATNFATWLRPLPPQHLLSDRDRAPRRRPAGGFQVPQWNHIIELAFFNRAVGSWRAGA